MIKMLFSLALVNATLLAGVVEPVVLYTLSSDQQIGAILASNDLKSTANYGDQWERRNFGVTKGNSNYGGGSHPSSNIKATANYGDQWERRHFGVLKGNSDYGGGSHPSSNIKSTAYYDDQWERRHFGVMKGNTVYGGSAPSNQN